MNTKDNQIINKVLVEIEVILSLVEGFTETSFCCDERTKRAVCMTLINIGELVKNLSEEFKLEYAEIPWRSITGMRDITAHKYQTLKMGDVWVTVKEEIPVIKDQLSKVVQFD
jgi:uncharacterized protein with HEPN domain